MFVAAAIVAGLLALGLTASAGLKLTGHKDVLDTMTRVNFPHDKLWMLAMAELAGAVGLVVGLFWWPIGVAAAVGVILYFVGAITYHLRVHDMQVAAPLVILLVSVAALVLRAGTA